MRFLVILLFGSVCCCNAVSSIDIVGAMGIVMDGVTVKGMSNDVATSLNFSCVTLKRKDSLPFSLRSWSLPSDFNHPRGATNNFYSAPLLGKKLLHFLPQKDKVLGINFLDKSMFSMLGVKPGKVVVMRCFVRTTGDCKLGFAAVVGDKLVGKFMGSVPPLPTLPLLSKELSRSASSGYNSILYCYDSSSFLSTFVEVGGGIVVPSNSFGIVLLFEGDAAIDVLLCIPEVIGK